MFAMLKGIPLYIIIGLVVLLILLGVFTFFQRLTYQKEVLDKQNQITTLQANIATIQASNDSLVAAIAQKDKDIQTITEERDNAAKVDADTIKDVKARSDALEASINELFKNQPVPTPDNDNNGFNADKEKFLENFNTKYQCRLQHFENTSVCD